MSEDLIKDRAWLEINLENLENNIKEIKRIIPEKTKIMAVVKANAYGHGIEISKKLNELGIRDFAVATITEAIKLRENKIIGNILILGYTSIKNISYLEKYDLIQTVVDEEYAKKLMNLNIDKKIKVHLKINTGMNRIGLDPKNIDFLKEIYQNKNIEPLGIFSHLCVADSNKEEDILFTNKQIKTFNDLIEKLKLLGIDPKATHLQSSYGILNYPTLKYDYVRPGIIMYGINSEENQEVKTSINLKPVLSLKARITSVKTIEKDSSVGYGRTYIAKEKRKIASVSIGYADGYPRNLSCKNTKVLVNKKYAPIIGRICMDQLMIDVTDIKEVKSKDIVTLIGEEKEISLEHLATKAETITNELASRLGERLKYIKIEGEVKGERH